MEHVFGRHRHAHRLFTGTCRSLISRSPVAVLELPHPLLADDVDVDASSGTGAGPSTRYEPHTNMPITITNGMPDHSNSSTSDPSIGWPTLWSYTRRYLVAKNPP